MCSAIDPVRQAGHETCDRARHGIGRFQREQVAAARHGFQDRVGDERQQMRAQCSRWIDPIQFARQHQHRHLDRTHTLGDVLAHRVVWPGALGRSTHPAQLAAHRCLYLNSVTTPGLWWYDTGNGQISVQVDGPLRTNSMAMACQAACQGLGIVFGPAFALAPAIRAGDLVPILEGFDSRPLDIHALYLSRRHVSTKLRLLIDFLAERFGA